LSKVTSVDGELSIRCNDTLTNLDGLGNISSVGGGLEIGYNPALINLSGLSNITGNKN